MNNMGSASSKVHPTHTISLPLSRDVRIVAHVWPTEQPYFKDIRFHIYATEARLEVELLLKLLSVYADSITRRPDNSQIGCVVQNLVVPLIQKKCEEMGFNMGWKTMNP
jgi:hypothetical protein